MKANKVTRTIFGRFALREVGWLVGLIVVVIVAFILGGFFSGGGDSSETNDSNQHASKSPDSPTIWTCSMHPQIKLPKPGKCPICGMDLIPLETGSGDEVGPRQLRLSETAKQLARIETTPATRGFASAEIRMVGKIAFDETRLAHITAWFPGRLERLYADYTGVTVTEGVHLADIYSPELYAAEEELIMASRYLAGLTRSSSTSLKQSAAGTLEAAREKLRLWGLSQEQIDDIEQSGRVSEVMTIYAPASGVVVRMNAREGMYVKTGTRIYSIADLTHLWVMFEAYESDLPWLNFGQQVTFTSPSFPGETFEGVISFIDPVVNPKTRTIQVRAVADNKHLKLKPDMFVTGFVRSRLDSKGSVIDEFLAGKWICPMHAEIAKDHPGTCDICGMDLETAESLGFAGKASSNPRAPILIPASAPMITGKRAVVYIEIPNDEGPLFEGREVVLGPRAGDNYIVRSGIEEGELVVTNGAFKIDSELQIQAKPSMMSPAGGEPATGHQHGQPDNSPKTSKQSESSSAQRDESSEAVDELTPLYDAFFDVQMALASDDLAAAKKAAERVESQAGKVDMSLFSHDGHSRWMELSEKISQHAGSLGTSENIVAARERFYSLAGAVIELHESFGHADKRNYYLTFCPMANDGKGAHWLQAVDTVYNSFYGESMLRCGKIKKSLAANRSGGNK